MASIQTETGLCEADCDQKAVWYCVEDKADLCENHKIQTHSMKIHRTHQIVPIADKFKNCRPTDCPTHSLPLCLYCQKCEKLCCPDCATMETHKEHNDDVKLLTNVAKSKRNEIIEIIEKNEAVAIRLVEERQLLQESIQRINNCETKLEKEIEGKFDRIRVYIDQSEKHFKAELRTISQHCRGNINSRQTDLNQIIEKVQGFLKEARQTDKLNDLAMIAKAQSIRNESENNQCEINQYLQKLSFAKPIIFQCDPDDILKSMKTTFDQVDIVTRFILDLPVNARWEQQGVSVAGGHGQGENKSQLNEPFGLFVDDDDDQTIVIADFFNHRIVQWKTGDTQGQVVAGGNGLGNRLDQLYLPADVLIDKETNSLIIADAGRVVRWSPCTGAAQGEILIENIECSGLAMDEQRYLYVSDNGEHEVRRYEIDREDKTGIVVAGGNGKGSGLSQLNAPRYLFVDRNQSLYVSDWGNHRVMKWDRGASQGVVVAGGQGKGSALTQLSSPNGIFVDTLGILYVAESGNDRVTRWSQGSETKGDVVVGGNGRGSAENQFSAPVGLSFDKHGNLYVADWGNHRVQRFNLIK